MSNIDLSVGKVVQVQAGEGIVRWIGDDPEFASGHWVGVELFEPNGKNDGSVKGKSYFSCPPLHGVFVRPSQVKESQGHTSSWDAGRVTPSNATPGPSRRPPAIISGTTIPPRQTSSPRPSASTKTSSPPSRSQTPSRTAGRASSRLQQVVDVHPSTPLTSRRPISRNSVSVTPQRSLPPSRTVSAASGVSTHSIEEEVGKTPRATTFDDIGASASPPQKKVQQPTTIDEVGESVVDSTPTDPSIQGRARPPVLAREIDELRIKLRVLETRRGEDQERIRGLEMKAIEAENFAQARGKLQAKFAELTQQLNTLRRENRDLLLEQEQLQTRESEILEQLEMATLDKEVAEERYEVAETELGGLKESMEVMKVEIEVLKEENAEFEKPPQQDGERSSLAFIQLEKHNERLKEALIRLRDVSSETEKSQRQRIAELEKDVSHGEDLLAKYNMVCAKLENADQHIVDLKQQLDNALGAEEMLEQLTERTLFMGEKIEEMRVTIEDLEALKDMNDELEEGHVEAEKQLQAEIDALTMRMQTEVRNSDVLREAVTERDGTIAQFRELVQFQAKDIEELREAHDTEKNEKATMASKSQAVMNLNLKLQSTAVKSQARLIATEIAKLELAQAEEHLHIVQSYLPSAYFETDHNATAALLFWERITSKAELLVSIICQIHGLPDALQESRNEQLVGICELKGQLTLFASLTRRFASITKRSTPEDYLALAAMLPEVVSLERPFDTWIELMKRDEFQERDCAVELNRLVAHVEHLAQASFAQDQHDLGERQLAFSLAFDSDLDNFAAAVGFARQACIAVSKEGEINILPDESAFNEAIYEPVQRILDQVRLLKISSIRLVERLQEIQAQTGALGPDVHIPLRMLATSVGQATDVAVRLAQMVNNHITEIRSSKSALDLELILGFLREITADVAAGGDAQPWDIIGMFITRLSNDLNDLLPKIRDAMEMGGIIKVLVPPPYLARVETIKSSAAQNADAEIRASRLANQIKDLVREVKLRDQSLQEAGVKIELMEKKVDTVRKQAETIVDLEGSVSKALAKENAMQDALDHLQRELDQLEEENAKLRRAGNGGVERPGPDGLARSTSMVFENSTGVAQSGPTWLSDEITTLKSAIRFLRAENTYLKAQGLLEEIRLLPSIPTLEADPELPVLDPTDSSDESEGGPLTPPPPSRHSLETRSKLLWRELADSQVNARVVDLTMIKPGMAWRPTKAMPEVQLAEMKRRRVKLGQRVDRHLDEVRLVTRMNATTRLRR